MLYALNQSTFFFVVEQMNWSILHKLFIFSDVGNSPKIGNMEEKGAVQSMSLQDPNLYVFLSSAKFIFYYTCLVMQAEFTVLNNIVHQKPAIAVGKKISNVLFPTILDSFPA